MMAQQLHLPSSVLPSRGDSLMDAGFWKAGHRPTLFAAFFYFDISFMVWVMLGPLGVAIASDLGLTPAQKGLMVATPVLAGALLRIPAGILVDHLRPRRTGLICQLLVIAGLLLAWLTKTRWRPSALNVGLNEVPAAEIPGRTGPETIPAPEAASTLTSRRSKCVFINNLVGA